MANISEIGAGNTRAPIQTEVVFDSGTADFTFSIRTQRYVEMDGQRYDLGPPHRMAAVPGDIAQVQALAPEIAPALAALWTPQVVAAYQNKMAALQAEEAALLPERPQDPGAL